MLNSRGFVVGFPREYRHSTQFHFSSMRSLYILFALSALACVFGHQVNSKLSFTSPFKEFDYSGIPLSICYSQIGNRRISGWECHGDAVINEHFIRLTPDRQSKAGACWSNFQLTEGSWVTTIKFRISGQVCYSPRSLSIGSFSLWWWLLRLFHWPELLLRGMGNLSHSWCRERCGEWTICSLVLLLAFLLSATTM